MTAKRDLAAIWTVLESNPPKGAVEVVGTGYSVAAGELLAGVGVEGRRYFLIPLLPGEGARIDTGGRAVHLLRLQLGAKHYLALMCFLPELYPVFTQFSREILTSVEVARSPARAAAEAFDKWKALFSDASERTVVGEAQLVGVLGELLTLEALLISGAPGILDYWRGPAGDVHDFRTTGHALEVKTTLVREGRFIGITSLNQLQPPPGARLCLAHHRLERDPSGFNLADSVQRLADLGAAYAEVGAGLSENGISIHDLTPYASRRFRRVETRTYEVTDPAFPRITAESFLGGGPPPGTMRFTYTIDLTNEPPSPLSEGEVSSLLEAMALEAVDGLDP